MCQCAHNVTIIQASTSNVSKRLLSSQVGTKRGDWIYKHKKDHSMRLSFGSREEREGMNRGWSMF